jgi:ABC-2 type transport system permease protein
MNALVTRLDKTLIRRELWENRSLWIVPLVTIGILTVLSLYMLLAILFGYSSAVNGSIMVNGQHFELAQLPDFAAMDPEQIISLVKFSPISLAMFFGPIMQIVGFFYLLDSLYADRKDRSVLFWRSMPVSDLRAVLAKLFTASVGVAAITFVAVVALELILLVFELIGGGILGVHLWVVLLHPWAWVSGWLILAYGIIAMTLWFLPYYAWGLLASSWARKAPLLWTVLPPLAVMGAEGWVLHSGHFARLWFGHAVNWVPQAFNLVSVRDGDLRLGLDPVTLESIGRYLASPELWIGLLVAALFTAGAVWLRQNRSEI